MVPLQPFIFSVCVQLQGRDSCNALSEKMEGNDKIQRTHRCVIPKVLRTLGCLPPYSHLSFFLCLLLYHI